MNVNLPIEYKNILESLLDGYSLKELKGVFFTISEKYQDSSRIGEDIIDSDLAAKVYAAYRLPATFQAVGEALEHVKEMSSETIESIIDVGAGSGSASLAASLIYSTINSGVLLERNSHMINVGSTLFQELNLIDKYHYINYDLSKDNLDIKSDLVIASYVLNELDTNARINAVNKMWNMTEKMMVIIEPGTPRGFSIIKEIRDYIISIGGHVVAPCTHIGECYNNWCHYSARVMRSKLHKFLKEGDAPYEDEKYCYIAFSKKAVKLGARRILRHPLINPGYVELEVCTPNGLEKTKITKKDKELFKRARKSKAGDLI